MCQFCFGKAKLSLEFILKIEESQKRFNQALEKVKPTLQCAESNETLKPKLGEVLKKIKLNTSISLKKVANPITVIDSDDDLLYEVDSDPFPCVSIDDSDSDHQFLPNYEKSDRNFNPNVSTKNNSAKSEAVPEVKFTCASCKTSFETIELLAAHLQTCFKDLKFQCQTCSKPFITRKELNGHRRTEHMSSSATKAKTLKKLDCEHCAVTLKSPKDLQLHIQLVHSMQVTRPEIYRCNKCEETFNSHLELSQHSEESHKFWGKKFNGATPCDTCQEMFPNRPALLRHMTMHHPVRGPKRLRQS